MKRALLLSSILLAGAGCATQQSDVASLKEEAITARADLVDDVFVSDQAFWWRTDDSTVIQVKLHLTFVRAENYDFDGTYHDRAGNAGALEYEVISEVLDVNTGTRYNNNGRTFFASSDGNGSYAFYDCDSSRNCSSKDNVTTMELASDKLTIQNHDVDLIWEQAPTPELTFTKAQR